MSKITTRIIFETRKNRTRMILRGVKIRTRMRAFCCIFEDEFNQKPEPIPE